MHMADALVSPEVGATMIIATSCVAAYSIGKVKEDLDDKKVPLMGVMGAFVFASQMINFTIPGTGSSGHIGGGILLAILLGPYTGFLTMASILMIQALFFGDGGLLALGCNIFNMGFYTCFIAYPLIYKRITKKGLARNRIFIGALLAAIIGLQFGAFSVVLETLFSNKTELPFGTFVALMQPIHLAIGIVEGLITAAIVTFVWRMRPEILENSINNRAIGNVSIKKVLLSLIIGAVVIGGGISWFASSNPDGLEWAMERTAGTAELEVSDPLHELASGIQDSTAILPDYGFDGGDDSTLSALAGTSTSGIIGGAMTLILAMVIGFAVSVFKKRKKTYRNNY